MPPENPYQPPRIAEENRSGADSNTPVFFTTRKVLWAHVAAVSCVTIFLYRAGGDLHAVQPPVLYVFVIPAVYSMFLFPPLTAYTLIRDKTILSLSFVVEFMLAFLHFTVVSSGFSSY